MGPSAWVCLTTTYGVALANSKLTLYVESGDTQPLMVDDLQISYVPPPSIETGLQGELVTKHFNSLVSENDMKWSSLQAQPGVFIWTNADAQAPSPRPRG